MAKHSRNRLNSEEPLVIAGLRLLSVENITSRLSTETKYKSDGSATAEKKKTIDKMWKNVGNSLTFLGLRFE